jgi:hypothetical protein
VANDSGGAGFREGPAGGGSDDETGLPPFVSTWGGFYRLVLAVLAVLIALFYAIQAYFA